MSKEEDGKGKKGTKQWGLFISDIQAATLTIAQGFSLAYQSWQMATRQKRTEFRKESKLQEGRVEEEFDNPDGGSILIQVCIYESRIYLQSLIKSGSN